MRIFLSLVVLILAACASDPEPAAGMQGEMRPAPTGTGDGAAIGANASVNTAFDAADYRLAAGDRVRVLVFGEVDLSGEFVVDGAGQVSLPLIKNVRAGGLTVRELEQRIETALADGYLKEPQVSAEVTKYRPFYILGEVTRPGTYPFSEGLTVLNAVATAEGFTYRANKRQVFIRREGADDEIRVDLDSVTMVRPGDTIRIGERFF